MRILPGIIAIFMSCGFGSIAFAQTFTSNTSSNAYITISPNNPEPHDQVTATVQSPLSDLSQDTISWSIDGVQVASDIGLTSYTLQDAGALGQIHTVVAQVSGVDGVFSAQTRIDPAFVDILVDSNSYVHPFYRGRALPGTGTTISLYAIPYIVNTDGSSMAARTLRYTWRINGQVLGSQSGIGKRTLTIQPPLFKDSYQVDVTAATVDGQYSAESTTIITVPASTVELYIDNSRLGLLFDHALTSSTTINDIETTVQAIPYGIRAAKPSDPGLVYAWNINGTDVPTKSRSVSSITLNGSGSSGNAVLDLLFSDTSDFFLNITKEWSIGLHSGNNASTNELFTPNDPFHTSKK